MDDLTSLALTRSATVRDALAAIDRSGCGVMLLVDDEGRFERTVTDGDLRRVLLNGRQLDDPLDALPRIQSLTAPDGTSRRDALALMDAAGVNHLPVLDREGRALKVIERREISKPILLSTPHMGDAELEFVADAFRTNWIAPLGPNVDAFEREIASLLGVGHAAAVSSGTAAIHLALRLLNVGPGDSVFCSTLTFAASANPIIYQGAQPVFIDSDEISWNMCPIALERAFAAARAAKQMPKAVIVVNLYGQSADMDPLLEICSRHGVPVIEDAAESLGARYKGKASGSFGLMAALSFNGNKIITTSGGGMLVSDDEDLIKRARFLATQARDPAPHYEHTEIGYNYRMSNILAGVGRGQLRVLEDRVRARRDVFDFYRARLGALPGLTWMPEPEWSFSTHWLTACTIDAEKAGLAADELIRQLADEMIEARPLWKPMHLQPVFAGLPYFTAANDSIADRLFQTGICLPSGSNMTDAELDRIVSTLESILSPGP